MQSKGSQKLVKCLREVGVELLAHLRYKGRKNGSCLLTLLEEFN